MHRCTLSLSGLTVALSFFAASAAIAEDSDARSLPMQFEMRRGGQAESCGNDCRVWVSAIGAITSDTPDRFETFAKDRNLNGVSMVLDSDGGSVLGAIALGRAIRRLGMTTTIGRTIEDSSSYASD